jgi:hypothetical protein
MSKELKKIIDEYKNNAESHGDATNAGDYKVANKCHDKLIKALKELRKLGEEGSIALLSLTDEKNDSIRCWAATHSLKYNTEKAEKTLQDLHKQSGPIAFNAEMVLSEWKKGTLEIP